MAKNYYKVRAAVWVYHGPSAWHFVNVDAKTSAKIKELHSKKRRGFGSVPVEVTIGKTTWKTSIFPDKQSGTYLLPLKSSVRIKEGIFDKDVITFSFCVK